MMAIKKEQFILIERFNHEDILGFLKEKAWIDTLLLRAFKALTFAVLFFTVGLIAFGLIRDLMGSLIQLFVVLLSIPFWIIAHELIHGIAYKFIGVKNVKYAMMFKKFIFYTIVYDEMISFKQLVPVLLAPSIILLVIPAGVASLGWYISGVALLCFHILSIGGDILLLNYYLIHKSEELYTEDLSTKETLIYKRNKDFGVN